MYCNDARDIAEVRASELALKEQVADLKLKLEVCEGERSRGVGGGCEVWKGGGAGAGL